MLKISIIVPVYNTEKYIKKCLNSLVNQTLNDIEIIVVNDGSDDKSENIIKEYVKKYPKLVKYYVKQNGGLSSARNLGLKYARGEYIAFVDSDDWVEKNMYQQLYQKAKEKNFDVVGCNINNVYNDKCSIYIPKMNYDIVSNKKIKESLIYICFSVCHKIYKRELLKNVKFKDGKVYEDTDFNLKIYPRIKKYGHVNKALYNYVKREESISNTYNKSLFDILDHLNSNVDYYKKNNYYDYYKLEYEYLYVSILYIKTLKKFAFINDKKQYCEYVKIAIKNVKQHFPKYRKNKYFYKNLKSLICVFFNRILAQILLIYWRKKHKSI